MAYHRLLQLSLLILKLLLAQTFASAILKDHQVVIMGVEVEGQSAYKLTFGDYKATFHNWKAKHGR